MPNEYYDHTTYPSTGASGSSSAMRAELNTIEAGFDKLPKMAGNGGEIVKVNSDGTELETQAADAMVAATIHAATSKATPVDADELGIVDSAASNGLKKLTWANLKETMYAAFGALVAAGTGKTTPVDADSIAMSDSAASDATKTLTFANLWAWIQSKLASPGPIGGTTPDAIYGTSVNGAYVTVASATTPDIFGAGGNVINYTGTATATGFSASAKAGMAVDLVCAAACSFTFGANVTSPWFASGYTYTAIAGERIRVTAITTTTFRIDTFPRSWSYTPTQTNVANVDSSSVSAFEVSQVGDSVTVTNGQLSIDATASATLTQVDLSFPAEAPSNIANTYDCTGFAFDSTSYTFAGGVVGNTANDRASVIISSISTANRNHRLSFTYVTK